MILRERFCISNLVSWEHHARDGRGGLGEVVATASIDCKCRFNVLINICLAYFLQFSAFLHILVHYG
jgi:hypothetical protein